MHYTVLCMLFQSDCKEADKEKDKCKDKEKDKCKDKEKTSAKTRKRRRIRAQKGARTWSRTRTWSGTWTRTQVILFIQWWGNFVLLLWFYKHLIKTSPIIWLCGTQKDLLNFMVIFGCFGVQFGIVHLWAVKVWVKNRLLTFLITFVNWGWINGVIMPLSEIKMWHLIKAADLEVWCTLTVIKMHYLGHMLHSSVFA